MKADPEIRRVVDNIQVINTHEHQEEESARLNRKLDFFSMMFIYAKDDLVSAGLSYEALAKCNNPDVDPEEKWRLIEPHYLAARNTAYIRAVEIAARDLYGVDRIDRSTCGVLSQRMQERNKPGVLKWILNDRCRIRVSQVNAPGFFRLKTDADLFQQDLSVLPLLTWPVPFEELAKLTGVTVKDLATYDEAITALFAKFAPLACAVKQQAAYFRCLNFDDVPDGDAAPIVAEALKNADAVTPDRRKALQDWAFRRCIRRCIEHDLPIKIHTGYEAGYNNMSLANIHPGQLINLFNQYPEARFDVFHIGYPYEAEVIALAKQYTGVSVDMCWAWIIDPQASRQFFKQFLTAVPATKLFAFGGDNGIAEPVYGHLHFARDGIARALTELVDENFFTTDEAVAIAQRVLHDNAAVFFRVDEKMEALKQAQTV